jgi:hypothetical protein
MVHRQIQSLFLCTALYNNLCEIQDVEEKLVFVVEYQSATVKVAVLFHEELWVLPFVVSGKSIDDFELICVTSVGREHEGGGEFDGVTHFVDKENRFMDRVILVRCDLNVFDGGVWNVDEVWVACEPSLKNDSWLGSIEVLWRTKQQEGILSTNSSDCRLSLASLVILIGIDWMSSLRSLSIVSFAFSFFTPKTMISTSWTFVAKKLSITALMASGANGSGVLVMAADVE